MSEPAAYAELVGGRSDGLHLGVAQPAPVAIDVPYLDAVTGWPASELYERTDEVRKDAVGVVRLVYRVCSSPS